MTDTAALLTTLNYARAQALYAYEDEPNDANQLYYQSLDELASAFEDMLDNAATARRLAGEVRLPLVLLESWVHDIAINNLYPDDSAYLQAAAAIRTAAAAVLTPQEREAAKTPVRLPPMYRDNLCPDDAVFPFLCHPTADTLSQLNDWLQNVGKAAARDLWRLETAAVR